MASTPPMTTSPTLLSRRTSGRSTPRSNLSLDLKDLPPLSTPAPPSNTLLITNLDSLAIFHPAALATLRQHLSDLVPNQLHSFAPLRSFRRIVCSFYTAEAAIQVRQELDGTTFLGANSPLAGRNEVHGGEADESSEPPRTGDHAVRARIYFGEPTPIDNTTQYLDKPDAGRLFFISPPPSPPVGWTSTREGAPNTETHATDLQSALEKLGSKIHDGEPTASVGGNGPSDLEVRVNHAAVSGNAEGTSANTTTASQRTRTRSGSSTVIYDPGAHATGQGKGLPAVMVEDTTDIDEEEGEGPRLDDGKKIIAHTSRPPVELMDD